MLEANFNLCLAYVLLNKQIMWNDEILNWMRLNWLQLNADKTEFIWCVTPRHLPLLPVTLIRVSSEIVSPSYSVRDLGVYIDVDLLRRTHVEKTTAGCFAAHRQIRSIRR